MDLKVLQTVLADVGKVVALLSVVIFIIHRLKYVKGIEWVILYLFVNLLISVTAGYFWKRQWNNLPLLHLNTFIEFLFFSLFYKAILKESRRFQRYFWPFITLVSLLVIANSIFLESIYSFNSLSKSFVQFILIGYAVLYIYSFSIKLEEINVDKQAVRLINAAVLIYYSSSLFIFLFSNLFLENDIKMAQAFWVVNAGLSLIFQLLILFGIWKVAFKQVKFI